MPDARFFPIQMVPRLASDKKPYRKRKFDLPDPLVTVDAALRSSLAASAEGVAGHFGPSFRRWPDVPGVAKVSLREGATANYRRPKTLFNEDTWPIIGGGGFRELYVSVLPNRLKELSRRILSPSWKGADAQVSTIASISPYVADDALGRHTIDELREYVKGDPEVRLKYRLFEHGTPARLEESQKAFYEFCKSLKIESVQFLDYGPELSIFSLAGIPPASIEGLVGFVGTRSISPFPTYKTVKTASTAVSAITPELFSGPEPAKDYPLVGIIDSGTDPNNPSLQKWVFAREDYIPRAQQDNRHGSFVAGLIAQSRNLNNRDPRFPECSAKIVDIVAFDRTAKVSEYDLRTFIESALKGYPQVRVWNLSFTNAMSTCKDGRFSDLAAFLDWKSRKHNVLFHIPTGNYDTLPLREWPPQAGLGEADRIQEPADSVNSITVGSVAHLATANSRVRVGEPSPFSCRGPGAAYLMKPELSGYGGNCTHDGNPSRTGILSLDGSGNVAEDFGTSFACPPISALSGAVAHELSVHSAVPDAILVKALQMHGAFLKSGNVEQSLVHYSGIGQVADLATILECTSSSMTSIFKMEVASSPIFLKKQFPMPKCLEKDGKLDAEVLMTLCYAPPTNKKFDAAYCRVNVDVSLHTMRPQKDEKGKITYAPNKEVPCVPKDKELDEGWEEDLIEHGYKWSPLKLYYRHLQRGPTELEWQLQVSCNRRPEVKQARRQQIYLLVTVRDPKGKAPVYAEMAESMNKLGWGAEDLQTRSREREKPKQKL